MNMFYLYIRALDLFLVKRGNAECRRVENHCSSTLHAHYCCLILQYLVMFLAYFALVLLLKHMIVKGLTLTLGCDIIQGLMCCTCL